MDAANRGVLYGNGTDLVVGHIPYIFAVFLKEVVK
jgi:hypothetical protein